MPLAVSISLIAVIAFAVSAILTWFIRRLALRRGLLDQPNARSSHTIPTPRGGGLAIVISATCGIAALLILPRHAVDLLSALAIGGALVALIGFVYDFYGVTPKVRFAVHVLAAIWALVVLSGPYFLQLHSTTLEFGVVGWTLSVIAIVWSLNLFNFMDGIDGIASSEAIFMCVAGAWLLLPIDDLQAVAASAVVVGAACFGFLIWNWAPARIFMGDVGSGYLGYVLGVFALASAKHDPVAIWIWLILGGTFFTDASVTLIRRIARREPVHVAHRTHAYQWLSRNWNSHPRVTSVFICVNLCWLLPIAWLCRQNPRYALVWVTLALLPLVGLALLAGAGKAEVASTANK